jgi:hypothetical protein
MTQIDTEELMEYLKALEKKALNDVNYYDALPVSSFTKGQVDGMLKMVTTIIDAIQIGNYEID